MLFFYFSYGAQGETHCVVCSIRIAAFIFKQKNNNQPSMSFFIFPLPFDAAGWLFSIFDGCRLCLKKSTFNTFILASALFFVFASTMLQVDCHLCFQTKNNNYQHLTSTCLHFGCLLMSPFCWLAVCSCMIFFITCALRRGACYIFI